MKTAPYVFALCFVGLVFYWGVHHFELPTFFLFDKTEKTAGRVLHTEWTNGVKGHRLQLVAYEFEANDSVYSDTFKAGKREGLRNVGDRLLIEYSIDNPGKNEVIGHYTNDGESIQAIKLDSKK